MASGKLWNDVSNGKGSKRRIGSDQNKYNEGWQRIFGKKNSLDNRFDDLVEEEETEKNDKKSEK